MRILLILLIIIIIGTLNISIEQFTTCKICKLNYYCTLNKHLQRKCWWDRDIKIVNID